ncbi:MAG TPA: hypothetical protein VIW67_10890 [Terriglobales bacterium]
MAQAVYQLPERVDGGWQRLSYQSDPDGFKAAAYQRIALDGKKEIRIVFAGTDDFEDLKTDVNQGSWLPTGVFDRIAEQQFVRAQAFASRYAHLAQTDADISDLKFVGHSLGGALAQFASATLDVPATVFNSSALLKMEDHLSSKQKSSADKLVTQFVLEGDPIQPGTRFFGGAQHGVEYLIKAAPGLDVDKATSAFGTAVVRHGMEGVVLSLNDAITRSKEPPQASSLGVDKIAALRDELVSQRVAVPREAAELIARNSQLLAEALTAIQKDAKSPQFEKAFGVPTETALKYLDKAVKVYEWKAAFDKDLNQFHDQPFVLVHSELFWKASEQGWSRIVDELYKASGKPSGPDFGSFDLFRAGVETANQGHLNVDSIEHGLDGLVGASWALVGWTASGGNPRVAQLSQQAGQLAAESLRFETRGVFKDVVTSSGGYGDNLLSMYRTAQERRRFDGQSVQTFDQWLGPESLKIKNDVGFTPSHDKQAAQLQQQIETEGHLSIKTIGLTLNPQNIRESIDNNRIALDLANPDHKAVVVGVGPLADNAYYDTVRRLGEGNVKRVSVAMSTFERNRIAEDFGADTVINISQEHYREITQAGYRRVEFDPRDNPSPTRKPDNVVAPPDNWKRAGIDPRQPPPPRPMSSIRDQMSRAISDSIGGYGFSSPRVGGVMLQGAAEMGDTNSPLTTGNFSLVFQGGGGEINIPTLRRFVTALWATYFTTNGPGISIDPIQGFTNRHVVRYIGRVVNSDLGRVMRETDYQMKSWAVGTSRPDIPNWLTPEEIGIRNGTVHVGAPSRFWFVPERMKFSKADNTLLFDSGEMTVKTEYLFGGKGDKNPENEEWAQQFTKRYAEIAQHYAVFDELFEYAKLVSLSKYLKQRRLPLLWFLLANREMVITEDSPGTVKAFAKKSDYNEEIRIAGGVDLSPGITADSYVVDAELLKALAEARKNSPATEKSEAKATGPIEIVQRTNKSLTVTPSQTVVISESRSGGDKFATDLGLRLAGVPHLEIARYRRTDFPRVHTFGRDWHLMIPYAVKPGSEARRSFAGWRVPETMILQNLLTGHEESLHFDTNKYEIAGYIPESPKTALNIGLFFLSDRTFRLADKLGCHFQFDEAGRLTDMVLAPNYQVGYEYAQKKVNWRNFDVLPFRLEPEGAETLTVQHARVPKLLRLHDSGTGNEQVFGFSNDNPSKAARYTPTNAGNSDYQFIALMTDGSFVLKHRSGTEIDFDAGGRFSYLVVDILQKMIQPPYEVRFEYDVSHGQYRIATARVFDQKSNKPLHAIVYNYSRSGVLEGTSIVSAK